VILIDTPIRSLALRRRKRDLSQDEGHDVAEWKRLGARRRRRPDRSRPAGRWPARRADV
jgi:hypothetical protein